MQLELLKHCGKCKSEKQPKNFYLNSIKCIVCEDNLLYRRLIYKTNEFWLQLITSFYQYRANSKKENERIRKRKLNKKPINRLKHNIRRRVRIILKRKNIYKTFKTSKFIGITSLELKKYIEKLWQPGMSWDNYGLGHGKWNIDHIKPISKFDLTNIEEVKACTHYTNLQPLWHEDNMIKGDKYGNV